MKAFSYVRLKVGKHYSEDKKNKTEFKMLAIDVKKLSRQDDDRCC